MINWKIEKRNISELKVYDKNPRKFTAKGLADLKKSLENCGDANIITINADNTVLGGHARLQVMKELGYEEVDVKVPDRLLTEKECKEVVIRLNANIAGEWDFDKLEIGYDFLDLNEWGLDVEINKEKMDKEIKEDKPELEFTEELLEEQNYIVLTFNNKCDWMTCCELLDIKTVKTPDSKKGYERAGVGRVFRGENFLMGLNKDGK